jgi:hypothetical protein
MPTPVLLPPPSLALTVHQAAAHIRAIAGQALERMARNDYWGNGWAAGITDALGGEEGELAALFTPELAIEFADWLDTTASDHVRHGTPLPPFALTAARAINATARTAT